MDLPRGQWSLLSRFRSYAEPCRNSLHERGYIASPLCDCGEHQTMRHIVTEFQLTCFDGGISELHQAHDTAVNWLLRRNSRSWKKTTTTTTDGSALNVVDQAGYGLTIQYADATRKDIREACGQHCNNYDAELKETRSALQAISKGCDNPNPPCVNNIVIFTGS